MADSKQSINSHDEDEWFLSRSYRTKEEFIKEYERYYYGKATAKDLYFRILAELQKAITEGNIDKFKRFVGFIDYISCIESLATLESYHIDRGNPIKKANFVILACQHDKIKILNYVFSNFRLLFNLSRDLGKDALAPNDKDEASHDAFYYAIRSGNVDLLDTLITKWPCDYFATRPQELDEVLSKAYDELKFRNVSLSDEMGIFVENKLINLRFFSNPSGLAQSARESLNNIRERVNLVLENIALLKNEYSKEKNVDERFLFVGKFIAQNVHVLKRQLRSTYDRLPWEEIEFCLVTFVSSYFKKQEINLFYRSILNKDKLLSYLENFAKELESCKSIIGAVSSGKIADLPKFKREVVVTRIINDNPQFADLYRDFQQIRDIYSLERINTYLNLALSIDPKEREGQLIITRALQVIGEYLKNTLESPNLSATTSELILLSLPKNTRKIIIDLRNSLSHVYSLSKRTEIEENSDVNFFIGVQKDTRRIDEVITDILYNNKIKMIRILLHKIISNKGLEEMKAVAEVLNNVQVDKIMPHKSITSDNEKLEKLIQEWNEAIPDQTNFEMEQFTEIKKILNFAKGKSENIRTGYSSTFEVLKNLSIHLSDHTLDQSSSHNVKVEAMNAFEYLDPRMESHSLKKLLELSMSIFHSTRSRIPPDNLDKVNRSFFEIYTIAQFGMNDVDMKWIEKLRERICDNAFIPVSKQKKTLDMTEDEYDEQLIRKLSELKSIFKKNVSGGKMIENLPSYCQNKKVLTVVEMLVLDIMSILDRSEKYLENNFLFLDDNTPLLTGKCLRNHLAHGNTLLDVLLSDPSTAVILNAEKLISENVVTSKKKFGKLVRDDPSKLRDKYDRCLIAIANQEKMFSALEEGNLEELKATLREGVDINARSINSWTALHYAASGPSLGVVKFVINSRFDANVQDCNGQIPLHIAATHGGTDIVKFFVEDLAIPVDSLDNYQRTPLHLAAKNGHKDVVEVLLKNNADTNVKDDAWDCSPLHYTVQNNHVDVFKILLEKEADVNLNTVSGGYTSLHLAAEYGCIEIVNILLERGADVNAKHDKEGTALHAATIKGNLEIVNTLILHGADINVVLLDGCTALIYAAQFNHEKITELLLKHGANVDAVDKFCNKSALHHAAKNGNKEIVEMLLKKKANVNFATAKGTNPLHVAIKKGHLKIVDSLVKHGSDIRARCKNKLTPLHLAAQTGHKDIVQLLIKNGAEVSAKANNGSTPLLLAAKRGHADIVDLLLRNKARIDTRDIEGNTPVFVAAIHGHKEVIEVLVKNKVDVNVKTNDGWTPLHLAAQGGHRDVVDYLLQNKSDLEATNKRRSTPLHTAVVGGHKEMVTFLLEKGANVDAISTIGTYCRTEYVETDGITPLHLAVELSHEEIVEILLANGANVNSRSGPLTPLSRAIQSNRSEIVEILIANGATVNYLDVSMAIEIGYKEIFEILVKKLSHVDVKNEEGDTLLHSAAKRGNKDMMNELIKRGVDVNAMSAYRLTPLFIAATKGFDEIVEVLITNGANVDLAGMAGTALFGACDQGQDNVVEVLLKNGADINIKLIKDGKSGTPLEAAVVAGHVPVVKTILQHRDVDLNAEVNNGWPLLTIAAQEGKLEMVKFLVDAGCDLHAKLDSGEKCIHIAAKSGFRDIIQFLLSKGLDIDEPGAGALTPLHYAALEDNEDVVRFLIAKGANINARDINGQSPLYHAASYYFTDTVKILLENGAVYNAKDDSSHTPLDVVNKGDVFMMDESTGKLVRAPELKELQDIFGSIDRLFQAVKRNCVSDVEDRIKAGTYVNAKNADTETSPLHYAAWKGYDQIINVLLQNKADPNAVCSEGYTPLHYAAKFSHLRSIETLICHGSIYNTVSKNGKMPKDFIKDKAIADLFKVIEESFEKVEMGNARVIEDLNKINMSTLKVIMNARNRENKTLIAAAALTNLLLFERLKELKQDGVSDQINKALSLISHGKHKEGLAMLMKLYEKRKSIFGADNPATLQIQTYIAKGLYKQGNYQQALDLYEEILAKQKDLLGLDSKDTLDTRSAMALLMIKMSKEQDALSIYEKVYQKQREILGPKHNDTLTTHFHMAEAFLKLKKCDEALRIYRSVYEDMKETFGYYNPTTISALNNVGIVLSTQGKTEEALKIYREVLEMKKLLLGMNHADTLRTMQNIAGIHLSQDEYHEALKVYQEVLTIQKKTFQPNHPETLNTQFCIGHVYFKQGKYISALKAFKECIDQRKAIFGAGDHTVAMMLAQIEIIYFKSKCEGRDPSEMLRYLQKDINIASSNGDKQKVQRLLQEGADVNDKDIDGRSPLHYAVSSGYLEVVNILLENGADVTQASNKGNTPLHTATSKGHEEIVEVLLKHVNRDQLSDFVNAKTISGGTASIHVAVQNGYLEVVKCLLNYGAIYNIPNKEGKMPIDLAKDQKIIAFLKLIEYLFEGAKKGDGEVIKKLKTLKPDEFLSVTNARNNQGHGLLQVAIVNKWKNIASSLLQMLKKSNQ